MATSSVPNRQASGLGRLLIVGLAAGVLATGFYGLLGRFTSRPTAIFVGVAAVGALLSLAAPLTMPVALSTRIVLALLHLSTAAIIVVGLTRYARQ